MATDILTDEQRKAYGNFRGDPTPDQLTRYCYLTPTERVFIKERRGVPYLQLGFAVQLMTVRFLGTFLDDPLRVPESVVAFAAEQLGIDNWSDLQQYQRNRVRFVHRQRICERYGYKDFSNPVEQWSLMRWLYAQAWHAANKPVILFDLATLRLFERQVLLPGVTVLERLVVRVVDQASKRLWRRMARLLDDDQASTLMGLLECASDLPFSNLEVLQRPVLRQSGPGLVDALHRYSRLRSLGVGNVDLSMLPKARIRDMAQQAAIRSPAVLRLWSAHRLLATLLSFAWVYETKALDDALDLFDVQMTLITHKAQQKGEEWQAQTRKELELSALRLADVCDILVNTQVQADSVREQAFGMASRELIRQTIQTVRELARPAEEHLEKEMVERYGQIQLFLPTLLRTLDFQATTGGQATLKSIDFLRNCLPNLTKADFANAPREAVSSGWKNRLVDAHGRVDRRAYVVWATYRLRDVLRCHDLYLQRSERWGNVQLELIQSAEWHTLRPQMCRTLDLPVSGAVEIARLSAELDQAYQEVNAGLPQNPFARIEGKDELIITPLEGQEEPESLKLVREQVKAMLPWVDLPELLLEIEARTQFADDFTPILPEYARDPDLALSLCATLLAEACNIGLGPVARADHPALELERLAFVQQNYLRAETIARANTRLVEAQCSLRLAQVWGGGLVASADGLRFVVPVKSANALPNRKYFGAERGITLFNLTSDQFTGLHNIIIPGTLRDSMYILESLLEQPTSLKPAEIMTDTASYTDIVFGLFKLLGYQFSPYLADVGDRRFWRINREADYGAFNTLSRHVININLILQHWDDILRVAGSLKLGRVKASRLMHLLQGGRRASTLARAIAEYGRLPKTRYLLDFVSIEAYRRRIRIQLNRGEGRHRLERAIFHGRRGEVREGYREGQEQVLGALGFVTNAVVLWNTIYMDAALAHLANIGSAVSETDQERLSPLGFAHINFHGRLNFDLPETVQRGQLRPLRTPKLTDPIRFAFT